MQLQTATERNVVLLAVAMADVEGNALQTMLFVINATPSIGQAPGKNGKGYIMIHTHKQACDVCILTHVSVCLHVRTNVRNVL